MKMFKVIPLVALLLIMSAVQFSCRQEPSLNVILVSIDTLRPDHLGCYGYEREISPAIDQFAREGVRFENAFSSTTWTLPAHHALLTSLPDLVHGVLTRDFSLDENRITLAEIMKEHGFKTTGIFTSPLLMPTFGFDQGFDGYLDLTVHDKELSDVDVFKAFERGTTTPGAMDKVEEFLDENGKDPFFLFLHLFDVHADFDPPAPYNTMFDPDYAGDINGRDIINNEAIHKDMPIEDLNHLIALYDGEIRFVDDAGIARLRSMLTERGLIDNTLIIITSDHGEEFFEHDEFGHWKNLHDTTLRIALIIWCPSLVPAGRVIEDQVRIIDIMPTILDLLELPQSPEGLGKSLAPLFNDDGGEEKQRALFAVLKDVHLYYEALRTQEFKVIRDYKKEERFYYDLLKDRMEANPIPVLDPDTLKDAMDLFFSIRLNQTSFKKMLPWGDAAAPKLDPELIERLKSLGYIK
jgi:arylsulfatase A-like enzyme